MNHKFNTSFFFVILLLTPLKIYSLEIDEKLTIRMLNVSDSRRTILVNRGLEDGVVVDDHAVFFLTPGVLARGVAVRVAPTRSVWSLYRLVDPEGVYEGRVANLKKTRPVRLTEDKTRELDLFDRGGIIDPPTGIRLAPGARDLPEGFELTEIEKREREEFYEMMSDGRVSSSYSRGIHRKTWELWSLISFNSMNTTSALDEGDEVSGTSTNMDLSAGIEKYRIFGDQALTPLSVTLFVHRSNQKAKTVQGSEISQDALGVGVGAHYHLFNDPLSFGALIGYLGISGGLGQSKDQFSLQTGTSSADEEPLDGSFNFFSLGLGMKYYLPSGFGFRGLIDYYRRGEKYVFDDDSEYTKVMSGPRIQAGLSWRW